MKNLNPEELLDAYKEEGARYSEENFIEYFREERSVNLLLDIYAFLEGRKDKRADELKNLMEKTIGKSYIEKYGIVPKEAIALAFLEIIAEREVLKTDYHGYDDYWHFDFISEAGHIIGIFINEVKINEIVFLDFFPYLEDLRITIAGLRKIKGLNKLYKLKYLDLRANCLTALPNLNNLTQLEVFSIGANPISFIEGIEQMKKLRNVDLDDTKLPKKYIKKIYEFLYGVK